MKRKSTCSLLLLCLLASCGSPRSFQPEITTFVVASTTSTQDSGFLDALGPEFERANPRFRTKVVAVGSGEAIELGRRGDADVLLTHSPSDEEKFMSDGNGIFRKPVMQNDFVIAGPDHDLASVRSAKSGAEAFRRIALAHEEFLSRGDQSGTHKRELATWAEAETEPKGDWYLESGQGMAETLVLAGERGAYLLADTATFRVVQSKSQLTILFGGDPLFVNPYSVIPVKRARRVNAALAFATWLTGSKGQSFIATFGTAEYGSPLFVPSGSR